MTQPADDDQHGIDHAHLTYLTHQIFTGWRQLMNSDEPPETKIAAARTGLADLAQMPHRW